MSTIEPQEPWASAMIAVGAVDPRREGVASRNRLGEIADVHTSTITGFIAGGASVIAVARRLGHKDPTETLRTYGHLWHDDEERMVAATDGLVTLAAHGERTEERSYRSEA